MQVLFWKIFNMFMNIQLEALKLVPSETRVKLIKMEDDQDDFKSTKVIKFINRKEDWTEFAFKFKAIADERGYDEILEGTVNVPRDM